jgi:hypothetical protein
MLSPALSGIKTLITDPIKFAEPRRTSGDRKLQSDFAMRSGLSTCREARWLGSKIDTVSREGHPLLRKMNRFQKYAVI